MTSPARTNALPPLDTFVHRHLGPDEDQIQSMLSQLGCSSLDQLVDEAVPASIRTEAPLSIGPARGEHELLAQLRQTAKKNEIYRSFIGMGYSGTITPAVIQRNILENPGWYTQYTPYQSEISQGRLESLLNFQTMIADLTGLPLANASLLDEATACAEAMHMSWAAQRQQRRRFFVDMNAHPQNLAVLRTRAKPLHIEIVTGDWRAADFSGEDFFGVLLQVPTSDGRIPELEELRGVTERVHAGGALVVAAVDLLSLALVAPPGEWGADIALGNSQRFGVPLGYGGPHAAFLSTSEEHKRLMPGRIIGVSVDGEGKPAYRLAMQTREQHIRRDKATSNICTAQALLANMAAMYGVYHGPDGIRAIGERVHRCMRVLAAGLRELGHHAEDVHRFDTLRVQLDGLNPVELRRRCEAERINLRFFDDGGVGIALDEATTADELRRLLRCFTPAGEAPDLERLASTLEGDALDGLRRNSAYMTHAVFAQYHSEHEMLRYLHRLQARDLSLTTSMIPLGSCTMKLNGSSELAPISWPEFSELHPFVPEDQARGYQELFADLEKWLGDITGFDAVSLQPNAGSQGEYAGLLAIHAFQEAKGAAERDVCLIPTSAHGTNPASAVMAGFRVVAVRCDDDGNIDVQDLRAKAEQYSERLGALMITYPSTHGVFEETIREICAVVHEHGGQVYMDGANMNAQVGLCRPAELGADVCHLNLHKTFCIPHGGGGPGMGPIGVKKHLAPHLPGRKTVGHIASAPYGSPGILPISWVYIALMGSDGLRRASEVAILNANYMAHRLRGHYDVLYTGKNGRVAHEFVIDVRPFKQSADVSVDDIAKRLIDYGFHAPTMSWPVPGTLMIEPTESESKQELDRYCDAMIAIREEIRRIEKGEADRDDNVLHNAPHTMESCISDEWAHPYSREDAGFPAPWLRQHKFWPAVGRVDNAYGDRHLVCSCPTVEEMAEAAS